MEESCEVAVSDSSQAQVAEGSPGKTPISTTACPREEDGSSEREGVAVTGETSKAVERSSEGTGLEVNEDPRPRPSTGGSGGVAHIKPQ